MENKQFKSDFSFSYDSFINNNDEIDEITNENIDEWSDSLIRQLTFDASLDNIKTFFRIDTDEFDNMINDKNYTIITSIKNHIKDTHIVILDVTMELG